MTSLVAAQGALLERVVDASYAVSGAALSRPAHGRFASAQMKTAWGRAHQQAFALMDGDELLAGAMRYSLDAVLDERPVRVCGIGAIFPGPEHPGSVHADTLVTEVMEDAAHHGADLALAFCEPASAARGLNSFTKLPMIEVELEVTQSPRHGAPMTLVRGGEARDLAAIAAMGCVRAAPFRFRLDRPADAVQHAVTRKRLLAGLGTSGARQLHFFIAEEGITAAAYVVISVTGDTWLLEECGDRDVSGARVGAMLQALIAREPVERRPTIRAWLPAGFVPPQVTITSRAPSPVAMLIRTFGPTPLPALSGDDVLYWHADVF